MPDKVLIDTSVWIEFFRKKGTDISSKLREYLKLNQACYTGPIAVELYQGAKTQKEIQTLEQLFQIIPYVEITRAHYHRAGLMSQRAARNGKIFSTIDMIIAVVAHDEQLSLFTLDSHFQDISQYCELSLITP
jgi:hypothetical protein